MRFTHRRSEDLMPFVFLLLFALVCLQSQTDWPEPPAGLSDESCAVLVAGLILASWFAAEFIAKVLCWQLLRHPEQRSAALRRYTRWRRYHFIGLLAAYLGLLYLCG